MDDTLKEYVKAFEGKQELGKGQGPVSQYVIFTITNDGAGKAMLTLSAPAVPKPAAGTRIVISGNTVVAYNTQQTVRSAVAKTMTLDAAFQSNGTGGSWALAPAEKRE